MLYFESQCRYALGARSSRARQFRLHSADCLSIVTVVLPTKKWPLREVPHRIFELNRAPMVAPRVQRPETPGGVRTGRLCSCVAIGHYT